MRVFIRLYVKKVTRDIQNLCFFCSLGAVLGSPCKGWFQKVQEHQ